ncbi:hypothetical protein J6T66_00135 [bacterium]|nr:hypothetical protein [bacterium]
MKKIFQNKKIKERDIDKLLTCFTYPAKESFSEKQEISLLEIISKYEKKYNSSFIKDIKNKDIEYFKKEYADFYKDLNNHTKKFAWIYY